jgi:hypothetical protein
LKTSLLVRSAYKARVEDVGSGRQGTRTPDLLRVNQSRREKPLVQKQLSLLGDCITTYKGEGVLTLKDGFSVSCTFEAGQLKQGDIFLFCDCSASTVSTFFTPAHKFEGTTTQGYAFIAIDNITQTDQEAGIHIYFLRIGTVRMAEQTFPQSVRYGVTNLIIKHPLPIQVNHKGMIQQLVIKPVHNHETIMWCVRRLKSIDVTCEIVGEVTTDTGKEILEEVVDNLCYLFSVAKGTKIEWLYRDIYDAQGTCTERMHGSRITKAYCPLSLIDEDRILQAFLEKTYSSYVANCERYALNQETIDAYLDAKAESDYLQIRGIKLAVAMEVLKDVFLNLSDTRVEEFVTKPNRFNKKIISKLKDAILPILRSNNLDITGETLSEKLPDINRRTFREILDDIFKQIDLQLTEEDTQSFIQSRNSLVHTGRFKSEKKSRGEEDTQPLIEEFCFLMSVLDKVFLRLLEYHGSYVDRRIPNQPNYYAQI